MPPSTDVYARSCNPNRRAKRLRSGPTPESQVSSETSSAALSPTLPPRLLTKQPQVHAIDTFENAGINPIVAPALQKRGRKSGLPRAAREAQRKLNHSMIEKARRTKINEALAALRAMVPADHGSQEREDREDDEVRDGEEWVAVKDRERAKDKGKKEEKEKEFKLEILVRAVSFMEDLIVKVRDMEAARNGMCSNCQGPSGAKRKRSTGVLDGDGTARRLHILRANMDDDTQVSCRLPSISSWLPHTRVDPSYVPSSPPLHDNVSYLPSPPSSTRSRPVPTVRLPPKLALDAPCAIPPDNNPKLSPGSSLQFSPEEDESAASLLLRISVSSSWSPSLPSSTSTVSSTDLAQSAQSRHLGLMHQTENPAIRQAQTPSSLLGMSSARIKT